jgi:hypothetical protein
MKIHIKSLVLSVEGDAATVTAILDAVGSALTGALAGGDNESNGRKAKGDAALGAARDTDAPRRSATRRGRVSVGAHRPRKGLAKKPA